MNRSESIMKWAIAIVIIFGALTAFFIMDWATVLKITLIITAIALIGNILLQSGRGGGLAAIGGLSDQSMMGAKTSSFLGNVTFLIGAIFFVNVVFLSKTSFNTRLDNTFQMNSLPVPAAAEPKDQGAQDSGDEASFGMSPVESSGNTNIVKEPDTVSDDTERTDAAGGR